MRLKIFIIKKLRAVKKKRKIILTNLAPFLILILVFGIFELTLRTFFPESWNYYRVSEDFSWELIPNVKTVEETADGRLIYVDINSKGLRDSEYDYKKPLNVYRILVIGDSFTEGQGVQQEEIYSEQLEKALGENYEVITVGVKAYGTAQELAFLKKEGLKYNPDLVVIGLSIGGELSRNMVNNLYTLKEDKIVEHKIRFSYLQKLLISMKSFANSKLQSYIFLRRRMGRTSNTLMIKLGLASKNPLLKTTQENIQLFETEIFLENPSEKTQQAWKITKELLREIKKVATENNVKLAIFAIPFKVQIDDSKFSSFASENNLSVDEVDLTNPQKGLSKICQDLDIPLIDPLEEFRKRSRSDTFYFDEDTHWLAKGHKLASEELYKGLKEKKLIPS